MPDMLSKPSQYVTCSHPGQLSLAIPPWIGAARCTSPVSVVLRCKLVSV